ncbi:enoyl-CoA hydratase/isomerase family protein [Parasphingorhabdus sp.]|jgi:enoyl-CoA hydratase/carnithine racemase|uniref:enoyl-CoA hydratase/isomerase family protein n=1 Tax=Parasphingorhabdus sp. TaxID=2709688 RepID=UPI003003165E
MAYETIKFETRDAIACITLNRPKAMNALSGAMVDELSSAVSVVAEDDGLRVLIITGAGRAFCCGADLKGVLAEAQAGNAKGFLSFLGTIQEIFHQLRELPKPTIAALNGFTLAGGLEMAIACDIVLAARSARLGDSHSNFGVLPGGGGGTIMPRLIGEKKANLLLFSGENWPAEEFENLGFVSAVHDDESLMDEAMKLADNLAQKSPLVLHRMKQMVADGRQLNPRDALTLETRLLAEHSKSADFLEGLSAFSEKRAPEYTGK